VCASCASLPPLPVIQTPGKHLPAQATTPFNDTSQERLWTSPSERSIKGSGHLIIASLLLLTLMVGVTESSAQVSTRISSISPDFAIANSPITITAELHQGEIYRSGVSGVSSIGESQYQQMEMDLKGNSASVTLPSRVVIAPNVEYYIVLRDRNNKLETYPLSESPDPFNTPPQRRCCFLSGLKARETNRSSSSARAVQFHRSGRRGDFRFPPPRRQFGDP